MSNRMWEVKEQQKEKESLLEPLGRIVAAYLNANSMDKADVVPFMQQVFSGLSNLQNMPHGRATPQTPVDIEKTITPDYLVCLESGKHFKMLKRHLRTSYGMTPEQYRERWSLPHDYPMVAPNYARKRSSLARSNGLGHVRRGRAAHNHSAAAM